MLRVKIISHFRVHILIVKINSQNIYLITWYKFPEVRLKISMSNISHFYHSLICMSKDQKGRNVKYLDLLRMIATIFVKCVCYYFMRHLSLNRRKNNISALICWEKLTFFFCLLTSICISLYEHFSLWILPKFLLDCFITHL